MQPTLTFVIPVRHPSNARDWKELKSNLAITLRSISNQAEIGWSAILVANRGSDLPALPPGVRVKWVDFPPNPLHEQGLAHKEQFLEAVRLDKGRRILAGMLDASATDYFMVTDDDDLVSSRLTGFVKTNRGQNGWFVRHGYIWSPGSRLLYRHPDFSMVCGTSHIVRADLFELPQSIEEASDEYIKQMLGSHIFITKHLKEHQTPLLPLPFVGAVYRTGHVGAHSRSKDIFSTYLMDAWLLKSPGELSRRISRLRILGQGIRHEFFGPYATAAHAQRSLSESNEMVLDDDILQASDNNA
ncbi:galactosyl transferase [Telluria aromaticivorans]|uniref:galactosyl transferase n=1 Tax=Telluria aromaticivorans TaxID=2725995 RepID=UPI001BB103E0|nr:galactosyl transferase [Telluria aromaticivorans]